MLKSILLASTLVATASSVLISSLASAQTAAPIKPPPASSVVISALEKAEYFKNKDLISEKTERCLSDTWQTHQDFFKKYGISKYYGDRNPNLNEPAERLAVIRKVGAPDSILSQLEGTSCIGLTRKCLAQAINSTESAPLKAAWSRIDANLVANQLSGMILIEHLQKFGWKVMYWNPAPENNKKWDAEEPTLVTGKVVKFDTGVKNAQGEFLYHPSWGMHEARYQSVMKTGIYYNIRVDDKTTMVGFGKTQPESFRLNPLFVATAHAGYHMFPGYDGQVIEAHSMRKLNSIDNMEVGEFNPLATGGSPKWTAIEKYRSGLVAVPPK